MEGGLLEQNRHEKAFQPLTVGGCAWRAERSKADTGTFAETVLKDAQKSTVQQDVCFAPPPVRGWRFVFSVSSLQMRVCCALCLRRQSVVKARRHCAPPALGACMVQSVNAAMTLHASR
eukprot:222810-Rhodomonas_salina.2